MKLKLILTAIVAVLAASIAIASSVVITPSLPDTTDDLICKVAGSNAVHNFYWLKEEGSRYSKTTGTQAVVPSTATSPGERWTCKVFTPSSGYLPEMYVGQASVTITEEEPPAETPKQCNDWTDNDGDGLVDMDDPGCTSQEDDDEYNTPEPAYQCSDGLDNDADGLTDMNDPGCEDIFDDDEYNAAIVDPVFQCSDELDNDADGLTDMNDPGCIAPYDNDEYNHVPEDPEDPIYQCGDGLDNDTDGYVDMDDPGCTGETDNDEYNEPEGTEEPEEPQTCEIQKVWINNHRMTDTSLEAELGQTLDIDIQLKCQEANENLNLLAEIYTGEHPKTQDTTGLFTVKPGKTYIKKLTLKVPEVMDRGNNKLRIKLFDSKELQKLEYALYIKELRHKIAIKDIITNEAKAGQALAIQVRAENQGYETEEDIRVDAAFLGQTTRTYIDKLEPFGSDEDTETAKLYMKIPKDTEDGEHQLTVVLTYGDYQTIGIKTIRIAGGQVISTDDNSLISITELPEETMTGKETQAKVMIVNLNDETKAYSLQVTADWAKVDSEHIVLVEAGKAAETVITLIPKEKGEQELTITVSVDGEQIAKYTGTTEVKGKARTYAAVIGSLAMIILVIGLVATVKSVQKKRAEEASYY